MRRRDENADRLYLSWFSLCKFLLYVMLYEGKKEFHRKKDIRDISSVLNWDCNLNLIYSRSLGVSFLLIA